MCKIRFCNQSCSAKYNNAHREYRPSNDKLKLKDAKCAKCNNIIKVNIRACKTCLCDSCREKSAIFRGKKSFINLAGKRQKFDTPCKCCGQLKCTKRMCTWFLSGGERTSKKMGMTFTKKGTIGIFDEILKVRDMYAEMYFTKQMSLPQIMKETGVFIRSIQVAFDVFGMKLRNLSQSVSLRFINEPFNTTINTINHTTWNGKEVILKSSNELRIAKALDVEKVDYRVEAFRIPYIDGNGIERFYIPDFYIPSKNLIIEAKGSYYADENCPLKAAAARNMGYNYQYVLDDVITPI